MSVQTVTLDNEYVVPYTSAVVSILRIEDEPETRTLSVLVQLGDKREYRYTIDILSGEDYTPEWTRDIIVSSIKKYFTSQ